MINQWKHECEEIVDIAQRLYNRNMLAGADGNISLRLSSGEILITPSGVSKGRMRPEEMALISLDNKVLFGNASSERLMHIEIYKNCPQARAVVHAHPPTAIAWSIAQPDLKCLPAEGLSEVILACGDIPFVPYARPGTSEMAEKIQTFLPRYRAMILSRHGALTWGEDLSEALLGMERIEHSAEILWRAQTLGGLTSLPEAEIQVLRSMRIQIGERLL